MRKGKWNKHTFTFDGDDTSTNYSYLSEKTRRPLTPHKADPKVSRIGDSSVPFMLVSMDAYRDMQYIMEESGNEEIAWLGSVKEMEDNKYLIERIFLFNQTVSFGSCEFDQTNISQFYTSMLKADPNNKELLNSILFWGHVHPGDGVEPSQQDNDQMKLFAHTKYFIRGIFSRYGHCVFTFFDYTRGLQVVDCPWQIYVGDDDNRRKEISKEIKRRVTTNSYGGGIDTWSKGRAQTYYPPSTFGDS